MTEEQEKSAVEVYQRLRRGDEAESNRGVQITRMLLEIGHAKEALVLLKEIPERSEEESELRLLRSEAYAAAEDYANAMEQCELALKKEPSELRVRRRLARLEEQARMQKRGNDLVGLQ